MEKRHGNLRVLSFVWACLVAAIAIHSRPSSGQPFDANLLAFSNPAGQLRTFNARGAIDTNGPFFQDLGSNGRTCDACHQASDAWSITPAHLQERFERTGGLDPVFRPNDGSNCEVTDTSTVEARRAAYSLLLGKGLIRVAIDVPAGAEFSVVAVDDPYGCGAPLNEVSMYRRPLPSTNLKFLTTVMWDGRETLPGNDLRANLAHQAVSATLGHAQASVAPTSEQVAAIVDFELGLATAQARDNGAGSLQAETARGGPVALSQQVFFPGINDPLGENPTGAPFDPRVFTIFDGWGALTSATDPYFSARAAIARGQAIFNTRTMTIAGVAGLNEHPALGGPFTGTCSVCHDTPNAGNHSVPAPLNIGLADAARRTADLPLYTLRHNTTGATVQTTDPGRAMITGKWNDIGKFKGPILRGLAARPPYFHNGFAATLADVVEFYDTRFTIGLTTQEKSDLVAFLLAL